MIPRWVAYRTAAGVDVVQACDALAVGHLLRALRAEGCTGVTGATVEAVSCRGCAGGTAALCPACQAAVLGPTLAASVAVCHHPDRRVA